VKAAHQIAAHGRHGNPSLKEGESMAEPKSLSGLSPDQAKEFHEQFKITYTAFAGIAAVAHFLVLAWKPWF
jgi:light-harvesting complex 1 beta chain